MMPLIKNKPIFTTNASSTFLKLKGYYFYKILDVINMSSTSVGLSEDSVEDMFITSKI